VLEMGKISNTYTPHYGKHIFPLRLRLPTSLCMKSLMTLAVGSTIRPTSHGIEGLQFVSLRVNSGLTDALTSLSPQLGVL
jgi:hypothetical protein